MNVEHLKLFVRLVSTRNISRAGAELGISPAVASVHINKLEEGLGVRLIHRTTRNVSLTEEGEAFLPYAEDVIASVEAARTSVGAGNVLPSGTLRVTAPASFGRLHVIPAINGFLQEYPDLMLDLRLSDSIVDLVEGGFDVAIRNASLKDSSLIARKLAIDNRVVCASPQYLDTFGEPETPDALSRHQCINLMGMDVWTFDTPQGQKKIKTHGRLRTDNGEAMRDACIDGLGISINSTWSVYKDLQAGRVVSILNDYPLASESAVWAVYPSSRLLAPKVRVFIDYFMKQFGTKPYWDDVI